MIGILNYYKAINYGAVLQCYALQKTIEQLGYDCEVINYRCDYIEKHYKLVHFRQMKQFINDIIYFNNHLRKRIEFHHFINKYLKLSNKQYNRNNIPDANAVYSSFIVGSDQVFNYTNTAFDKTFFLDFVDCKQKKNSYSASFGFSSIPKPYVNEYKRLLDDFNNLSFREESGCSIYKELTGKESSVTLDPTLLLDKRFWEFGEKKDYEEYILIYMLERSTNLIEIVKQIQRKLMIKVICIGSVFWLYRDGLKAEYKGSLSPSQFVELFKNASFVVTNSFHGTAFSIIFQKEFFTQKLKSGASTNNRFFNLLNSLGLLDRLIESDSSSLKSIESINYDAVNTKLAILQEKSLAYLRDICEGTES